MMHWRLSETRTDVITFYVKGRTFLVEKIVNTYSLYPFTFIRWKRKKVRVYVGTYWYESDVVNDSEKTTIMLLVTRITG